LINIPLYTLTSANWNHLQKIFDRMKQGIYFVKLTQKQKQSNGLLLFLVAMKRTCGA